MNFVFGEVRLSSVRINQCERNRFVNSRRSRVLSCPLNVSRTNLSPTRLLAQLERDLLLRCELKQMGVALHELISQVHVNVHVVLHAELSFDVRDEL